MVEDGAAVPSSAMATTALIAVYAAASSAVFALITAAAPEPYMDEIFHVPQAVKYCQGRFREVREKSFHDLIFLTTKQSYSCCSVLELLGCKGTLTRPA